MRRHIPSFRWFFFAGLFCISVFLTLHKHRNACRFDWNSELFSDGAGYYAYLPVTFLYHFDYSKFPSGIDDSTGCSFVDHQNKKFVYKYTCGVAALVSPFFAATVLFSGLAGIPLQGGFSNPFHRMADVAAVFYLILGLFFTGEVLKRYVSAPVRYGVLIFICAGTNLYYYFLRQPMMSHVYSFFIIALFVYAIHLYTEKPARWTFLLVAFTAAFAILIRPANGVVLILLPFWNTGSVHAVKERMRSLLTGWNILVFLAVCLGVFLPQMLYWQYMFGTPIHYAYSGETFANWSDPRFAEIWFAPLNGLFLYNPLWLVPIAGVILMIVRKERNGILLLLFFLLVSYIISAWHSWFFGCGYGHRAFIDFLPLFAIPFGIAAERVIRTPTPIPAAVMVVLLSAMSYYNLRMIYSYSGCFFGSVWDWHQYSRQLRWAGFYDKQAPVFLFSNDFENGGISSGYFRSDSITRSYDQSVRFDSIHPEGCRRSTFFYEFATPFPTHADAAIFIWSPEGSTGGAQIYCMIEKDGRMIWQDSSLIDPFVIARRKWCSVPAKFNFAPDMPWDATISVGLRNPGGAFFFADDMKVLFY